MKHSSLSAAARLYRRHEVAISMIVADASVERQVGEICVSGPSIARGYYKDPEGSQRTFGGGWLRTGDLGYLTDGSIYVTGRKKDLIIVNGRNYDPQQIEWIADELPNVRNGSTIAFSACPGRPPKDLSVISRIAHQGARDAKSTGEIAYR